MKTPSDFRDLISEFWKRIFRIILTNAAERKGELHISQVQNFFVISKRSQPAGCGNEDNLRLEEVLDSIENARFSVEHVVVSAEMYAAVDREREREKREDANEEEIGEGSRR